MSNENSEKKQRACNVGIFKGAEEALVHIPAGK